MECKKTQKVKRVQRANKTKNTGACRVGQKHKRDLFSDSDKRQMEKKINTEMARNRSATINQKKT